MNHSDDLGHIVASKEPPGVRETRTPALRLARQPTMFFVSRNESFRDPRICLFLQDAETAVVPIKLGSNTSAFRSGLFQSIESSGVITKLKLGVRKASVVVARANDDAAALLSTFAYRQAMSAAEALLGADWLLQPISAPV
jgi:hypothetical protein